MVGANEFDFVPLRHMQYVTAEGKMVLDVYNLGLEGIENPTDGFLGEDGEICIGVKRVQVRGFNRFDLHLVPYNLVSISSF